MPTRRRIVTALAVALLFLAVEAFWGQAYAARVVEPILQGPGLQPPPEVDPETGEEYYLVGDTLDSAFAGGFLESHSDGDIWGVVTWGAAGYVNDGIGHEDTGPYWRITWESYAAGYQRSRGSGGVVNPHYTFTEQDIGVHMAMGALIKDFGPPRQYWATNPRPYEVRPLEEGPGGEAGEDLLEEALLPTG